MLKHIFSLTLLITISNILIAQNGDRYDYINRYKDIAIREMERTGVPASIKLGQGILESNAGKSYLAQKGNNHFGMKCGSKWKGKKVYRKDDDYDKNGKLIKSCFRAYKSAEESYIAHSNFLRDPNKRNRYSFLFDLNPYDYKAWAKGLKKAGYATSKTYAQKLIKVIEDYDLDQYDRMSSSDLLAGNSKRKRRDNWNKPQKSIEGLDIQNNNHANMVLAREGQTPREIAEKVDLKLKCILVYNEKLPDLDVQLPAKTRVYIQPKRNGFRGSKKWHYVKSGETMYEISQIYGVKLEKLYKRNRLPVGTEPALGERIKLKGLKIRENEVPDTRNVENDPEIPVLIDGKEIKVETEEDPFMDESEFITPDNPTEINPPKEETEEEVELELEEEEEEKTEPEIPMIEPEIEEVITTPIDSKVYHIVQSGDTLYNISRKYETTVGEIQRLNNLTSNVIFRGQKLRVK
jgi:LysM repeat protein